MNLIEKQQSAQKSLEFLISKGYKLRLWVTEIGNAPKEFHSLVETKKICLFTLTDRKGSEVIEQFVTDYAAVPSPWERTLRSLVSYK